MVLLAVRVIVLLLVIHTTQSTWEEHELGSCTCEGLNTDETRINCRGGFFLPMTKLQNLECSNVDWITIRDTSLNYANLPEFLLKQNANASISANYVGVRIGKLKSWAGKYLSVQGNHITKIDAARLINVELLDVSHNQLSSLNLSVANNLKQLYADRNSIREVIGPTHCSIVEVRMKKNRLNFLPTWLRSCSTLESLEISRNTIESLDVSESLKLKIIMAEENEIYEFIPPSTNCSLIKIVFQHNNFTRVPAGLKECPYLEHVDFQYNHLTTLPDWFMLHFIQRHPEMRTRITDRTFFIERNPLRDFNLTNIFQQLARTKCESKAEPQYNCTCSIDKSLSTRWSGNENDIWTYTVPESCLGAPVRIWIDI